MVTVRTKGEMYGEHQDGDGDARILYGPFLIETNTQDGTVTTRTKRRKRSLKGTRLAMSAQLLQRVYAEDMKAEEYAKTPPRSVPKPHGSRKRADPKTPAGFQVCPECRGQVIDGWTCERCDGGGLVRIQIDGAPDD